MNSEGTDLMQAVLWAGAELDRCVAPSGFVSIATCQGTLKTTRSLLLA